MVEAKTKPSPSRNKSRVFNVFLLQNRGELLVLRYAARWGHEMLRGFLKISNNEPARHMVKNICPCQFVECHLKCKPEGLWWQKIC
jgi:hypothetical protein